MTNPASNWIAEMLIQLLKNDTYLLQITIGLWSWMKSQ